MYPNFKANFKTNNLGTDIGCSGLYKSKYLVWCRYRKTKKLVNNFVICHAMESDAVCQAIEPETHSTIGDTFRVVKGLASTRCYISGKVLLR